MVRFCPLFPAIFYVVNLTNMQRARHVLPQLPPDSILALNGIEFLGDRSFTYPDEIAFADILV